MNFLIAPLPNTTIPWLWCRCSGLRACLFWIGPDGRASWHCLRCKAQVAYGSVIGV